MPTDLLEAYKARMEEFYNPAQPRDREGQWTSGGGGRRTFPVAGYGPKALPDIRLGKVRVTYKPDYPDDGADPGEIVWAKIPFEDDPSQSKDRPVLVIGRVEGTTKLAAFQLTSKVGKRRDDLPIGTGSWDRQGRPSSLRLGRIVQIDESNYRREGSVMPRQQFERVVGHLSAYHRAPVSISASARELIEAYMERELEELACYDKSCAPPPVGTGGSKGGKPGRGGAALSPSPDGRPTREFTGEWPTNSYETTQMARRYYEHDLGDGYSSEVSVARDYVDSSTFPRGAERWIKVEGVILDADSVEVGEFERIINKRGTEVWVEHDFFKLDASAQGKGLGSTFNDKATDQYLADGVDRIELYAGMGVGAFAWARAGYRYRRDVEDEPYEQWVDDTSYKLRAAVQAAEINRLISAEAAATIRSEIVAVRNAAMRGEDVEPAHFAAIGQDHTFQSETFTTGGDTRQPFTNWVGKSVLTNSTFSMDYDLKTPNWPGVYYLGD